MFIRYNQLAKYWEYDGSGGVGTGPWIKLEIDYSQIINAPAIPPPFVLPANVALKDAANTFTAAPQSIEAPIPQIRFLALNDAAGSRAYDIVTYSQSFQIRSLSDDYGTLVSQILTLLRDGNISVAGGIYEQNRPVKIGEWQNVPFNAGNFIASSGAWTVSAGQVLVNRYTVIGKTITWSVRIQGSATSGPLNQYMHIYLPGGVNANAYSGSCKATEAYDGSIISVRIWPNGTGAPNLLTIQKEDNSAFTPGILYLAFTLTFEFL